MAISSEIIEQLKSICGPENVLTEKEDLIPYSFDGTAEIRQLPDCVLYASTVEVIQEVLKFANEIRCPVVTRGSGTGLSGGSVPVKDCWVLCTVHMDEILEVDPDNMTLMTEPGVTTLKISEAAEQVGLFYPPDPGSMKISTIGGNVAENSGGLRGLKYGVTRNYVMGLEIVLASGKRCWYGNKCVKDVAGYSMKDVFIGSEGTLGVITKVLLKLIPMPAAKKTMVAGFSKMDQAAEAVTAIIAAKVIPCTLEFLDRMTIKCVEDFTHIGLPLDCDALLLMETDGHAVVVAEEAEVMERICRDHGCTEFRIAGNAEEALKLASARRTAFSALARVSPTTILEDVTVPRTELARMVRFIQKVAEKYKLKIGIFGHMGDGNLHPTFLTDERNKEEIQRVHQAFEEIFTETIRIGGTITGEHGIGLAKKDYLVQAMGDVSVEVMRKLRTVLDPNNILNPGKIFD